MITALWIVGYVIGALIFGRTAFLYFYEKDRDGEALVFAMFVWPGSIVILAAFYTIYGAYVLVTMPTLKDRRIKKHNSLTEQRDRAIADLARVEKELEIGKTDDIQDELDKVAMR